MGRRNDHNRHDLEALCLEQARSLLREEGLAGFSTRKVATRMGYTVGTVYHLFGSYDGLMLRINAETLDQWYTEFSQAIEGKQGKYAIEAMAYAYYHFAQHEPHLWQALFQHQYTETPVLPAWYKEKIDPLIQLLENALHPICSGNSEQVTRAAHILWAGLHGLCMLHHNNKLSLVSSSSVEDLMRDFVTHYLAGLAIQS